MSKRVFYIIDKRLNEMALVKNEAVISESTTSFSFDDSSLFVKAFGSVFPKSNLSDGGVASEGTYQSILWCTPMMLISEETDNSADSVYFSVCAGAAPVW